MASYLQESNNWPTNNPNSAESDDGSSEGETILSPGEDLRKGVIPLNMDEGYVPHWTLADAFREYFQNWKDAILDSFSLRRTEFRLDIKKSKQDYLATVRTTPTCHGKEKQEVPGRLLGFIRYSNKNGTVELTNFEAQLTRKSLRLGSTTKRNGKDFAGTHGEGYKVASKVMIEKGHRVRNQASSFYWNFSFNPKAMNDLCCTLSPILQSKIQKEKKNYHNSIKEGTRRCETANSWEDVTVLLGRIRGKGKRIELVDFKEWIKVSLDLYCPIDTIETKHGSLILDAQFQGRIYLKGLLVENSPVMETSVDTLVGAPVQLLAKQFRYSYNFIQGRVDRDRRGLKNPEEEAIALAAIWEEAIKKRPLKTVKKYVDMLRGDSHLADVGYAKDYISRTTAEAIWRYLLTEDTNKKRFYHDHKNADKNVDLIKRCLKKKPVQLPSSIWEPLRKLRHPTRDFVVRTPQEQQRLLMRETSVGDVPETLYSQGLWRAIRAVLALDERTKDLTKTFRKGDTGGLDLLLSGSELLIHARYLDFNGAHNGKPCMLFGDSIEDPNMEVFSCDHIVTYLYRLILAELAARSDSISTRHIATDDALYLKVTESLREMPRKIEMTQGSKVGEIDVSWVDDAGVKAFRLYGLIIKGRVTLHREETCSLKRNELLAPLEISEDEFQMVKIDDRILPYQRKAECGCPEQIVLLKEAKTTFYSLDPEEYFPMMASLRPRAFFGLPPSGLPPKTPEDENSSNINMSFTLPCHAASPAQERYSDDDLCGLSDSDGDEMQIDLPPQKVPSQAPKMHQPQQAYQNQNEQLPIPNNKIHRLRSELQESRIKMEAQQQQQRHQSTRENSATESRSIPDQPREIERLQEKIRQLEEKIGMLKQELKAARSELAKRTRTNHPAYATASSSSARAKRYTTYTEEEGDRTTDPVSKRIKTEGPWS